MNQNFFDASGKICFFRFCSCNATYKAHRQATFLLIYFWICIIQIFLVAYLHTEDRERFFTALTSLMAGWLIITDLQSAYVQHCCVFVRLCFVVCVVRTVITLAIYFVSCYFHRGHELMSRFGCFTAVSVHNCFTIMNVEITVRWCYSLLQYL